MKYADLNEQSLSKINPGVTINKTKHAQHEHAEQVALFQWAAMQENVYPSLRYLFAVPNGGLRAKITAVKMKAEGAKKGVPDVFLARPIVSRIMATDGTTEVFVFHGLWIEMKVRPNRTTKEQTAWLIGLGQQGYATTVCYSWEDARDAIICYLAGQWRKHMNFGAVG